MPVIANMTLIDFELSAALGAPAVTTRSASALRRYCQQNFLSYLRLREETAQCNALARSTIQMQSTKRKT